MYTLQAQSGTRAENRLCTPARTRMCVKRRLFRGKSHGRAALSFQNVLSAHLRGSGPDHFR